MKIVLYQMRLKYLFLPIHGMHVYIYIYIYNNGRTYEDKYKFRFSLSSDRSPVQNKKSSHAMLYVFFWVIPLGLNFHLYRHMEMKQSVPKRRHIKFRVREITQKKAYNLQNTAKVWNQESLLLRMRLHISMYL